MIASDDAVSRRALKLLLQTRLTLNVVGEARDAAELLRLAEDTQAELVLVDGDLPGVCLAALVPDLHQLTVSPHVIVLGSQPEAEAYTLSVGADAFVWKVNAPRALLTTVERTRLRRLDGQ